MSDLPIPFTAAMVQAILREIENPGTGKTQTRRGLVLRGYSKFTSFGRSDTRGYDWHLRDWEMRWHDLEHARLLSLLPYKVGDRLYVREAWRVSDRWDSTRPRDLKPRSMTVFFEAGGSICNQEARDDWRPSSWPEQGFAPNWGGKLRPPMFMPQVGKPYHVDGHRRSRSEIARYKRRRRGGRRLAARRSARQVRHP